MRNRNIKNALAGFGMLLSASAISVANAQSFTEGFGNLANLTDWYVLNNSDLPSTTIGWGAGNPATFPAQAGATNAYLSCNYQSTTSTGTNATISNWLFTPSRVFNNGDVITFYTRKPTAQFPDRLQVRMNTNGPGTNVGTTSASVGDYTTLLLDINPTLTTTGYPITWTQYTITISGLSAPVSGRIAFRYFVTSGGANGNNSDYIGIDTYSYTSTLAAPANDNCAGAITLTHGASCTPVSGTVAGATASTPVTTCDGTANDDVWYKFVATSTNAHINLVGSSGFDGIMEVFSGANCAAMTSVTCQDTSVAGGVESMRFANLTVGQTYYIRVFDYFATFPATLGFTICVESFAPCTLTQPAGSIAETELCGGTGNDGCNATPAPVYQDIMCGDVIWGSSQNNGATRDLDWYRFTVTSAATATLTVNAEFPATIAFVNISNCATPVILAGSSIEPCTPSSVSYAFTPGTYVALVGTNTFYGYSCNSSNDYSAALTMTTTPTVLSASGSTAICSSGGSVALSSTGTAPFVWNNGSTVIPAVTGSAYTATTVGTYTTVSKDLNGCNVTSNAITISNIPVQDATFSYPSYTLCTGSANAVATAVTPGGTFSSTAGLSLNAATGEINLATSTNGTYTVTYTTGGTCPGTSTHTVTVTTAPDASFSYALPAYCMNGTDPSPVFGAGASAGTFASTSGLVIDAAGLIDLSASTAGTYTVTNSIAASGSCVATSATTSIVIEQSVSPNFAAVTPVCSGAVISPLPTTSVNGVDGTWSPAINNTATTTYTFTPAAGECATGTTLVITVNDPVDPAFAAVGPFCEGETITALPLTSSNGIDGTWSPAINNTATTTYTFTPASGECATTETLVITINDAVVPTFAPVATLCVNATAPALPAASGNGINGTWSPATISTATAGTSTYTFTATAGQCAENATLSVTVDECLSVKENLASDLSVFPNPAANEITVSFTNSSISDVELALLTNDGKVILVRKVQGNAVFNEKIDLSEIAKGVYFVRLSTANGTAIQKVVKQ